MKKYLLLLTFVFGFLLTTGYAIADEKDNPGDEALRRSLIIEPNFPPDNSSFPMPFTEINNPVTSPAISTGYYFVDSDDEAPDFWRPNPEIIDTNFERSMWTRIIPGPRILPREYWDNNPDVGLGFFRNPAVPNPAQGSYFDLPTDSTDNAIAGPIKIGFGFYFNGLRYDSFYVSTNGIIALTNRRYFYDANGQRYIPPGATSAYDPMSMDWFVRARTGDGLDDQTPDDFGYQYSVLANRETDQTGGIRYNGGRLNNTAAQVFPENCKAALIAPFFGSMHLSQFWKEMNMPDNHGQVWYKRSTNADKLIIYFINIAPKGTMSTPYGNYTANPDLRPGDQNYVSANAQVILNRLDSSITIVYERFTGIAFVSGRGVPANTVFRYNSTVGVRGFARHVNYGQGGDPTYPWASEYQQYTHYFNNYANPNAVFPRDFLAIKFKQWKNVVRVVDIQYRIRKLDPNATLDFTEEVPSTKANDYELLAGDDRLGALQPVALLQNLTNNIQGPQGVNYVKQQLNFRARFRIVNLATNRIIYNRLVPIDSTCLSLPDTALQNCTGDPYVKIRYSQVTKSSGNYKATPFNPLLPNNYNGIPPYGYVQIFFPPFEPNEFVINQIGRMRAFIIADPTDPRTGAAIGDQWPFDDTASVRIFVMKRLEEFSDDVTEYHIIERVPMPSVLKWVNIDAEVASGDEVSDHPLPPRGEYAAANNENFKYQSPVIRMNRLTLARTEPATSPGGDEIRSFPIDLRNRYGAVLSLAVQRSVKSQDWPRGWSDQQCIAPEPRTVVNGDMLTVWTNYSNSVARYFDRIDVELALPSDDGVNRICNITDDKMWRTHPRRGGAKAINTISAYSLFGAGGAQRAFLETDKDSTLEEPKDGLYNGLRPDIYDDGIDFEYKKIFVAIPDTFISWKNEGAKNFRFRIKVRADNHKAKTGCVTCIPDDDDPFFVDNVRILFRSEVTDMEVSSVTVLWPYSMAPASQAIKIPVRVKVNNNTSVPASAYFVKVKIYKGGGGEPIYCRREQIPFQPGGTELNVVMPNWDAQKTGDGKYKLEAIVTVPGGDLEPKNDTTFWEVTLKFGDVFAYDPATDPRNDVPDQMFTGLVGRGLNLYGFAAGGNGSVYGPSGGYDENQLGAGYEGGNGSGQIAMLFELYQSDTLYGYKASFGKKNQALDDISLAIYTDQGQPGQIVNGSLIYKQRGYDDILKRPNWEEDNFYYTYLLEKPLVLPAGKYWYAIGQMGETGMELGASKTRVGMRTTSIYIPPPITMTGPVGGSGIHLVIEKTFRKYNRAGNLINNNFFAYENTRTSGTWVQFMPTIGNPAYAHLHHFGISPADNSTATLSRGTWIPMIRPYLGNRPSNTDPKPMYCPDDIPVELTYFNGYVRNTGIDLFWETASEINNYGFYVERRLIGQSDDDWQSLGFVKGSGNSTSSNSYNFRDKKVVMNKTYQYRLRQVDLDGIQSCEGFSDIITIKFDRMGELILDQNTPNPFTTQTTISFTLPVADQVKLEVLDVYGNVVKTLVNGNLDASNYQYVWDGTNNSGRQVASGTYLYRLTAGNEIRTSKMTLVR